MCTCSPAVFAFVIFLKWSPNIILTASFNTFNFKTLKISYFFIAYYRKTKNFNDQGVFCLLLCMANNAPALSPASRQALKSLQIKSSKKNLSSIMQLQTSASPYNQDQWKQLTRLQGKKNNGYSAKRGETWSCSLIIDNAKKSSKAAVLKSFKCFKV